MAVNSLMIQIFGQRFRCYDSAPSHTTISVERLVATRMAALACFGPFWCFHVPETKNILEHTLFWIHWKHSEQSFQNIVHINVARYGRDFGLPWSKSGNHGAGYPKTRDSTPDTINIVFFPQHPDRFWYQLLIKWVSGLFLQRQDGRSVKLITYLNSVPRLRNVELFLHSFTFLRDVLLD
jgi:hypothetical protein